MATPLDVILILPIYKRVGGQRETKGGRHDRDEYSKFKS